MLTRNHELPNLALDFTQLFPPNYRWRRIALVAVGAPDAALLTAACTIARHDGAKIVLYDVSASGGLTSPYPPGAGGRLPDLLDEAAMRRVGRDDLAVVAYDLAGENLLAGIYLAPKSNAADLASLVAREGVDLVISSLPSGDRKLRRVHEARRHAHVLLASPGTAPVLYAPLGPDDEPTLPERVGWLQLLVVIVTFFLARRRGVAR